jgi:hypothetical protein
VLISSEPTPAQPTLAVQPAPCGPVVPVNLIVLEHTSIRYVEVVEGSERLRFSSRIGDTRPAHCTAAGKVLLAALPRRQLDLLYPTEELIGLTPRSIAHKTEQPDSWISYPSGATP